MGEINGGRLESWYVGSGGRLPLSGGKLGLTISDEGIKCKGDLSYAVGFVQLLCQLRTAFTASISCVHSLDAHFQESSVKNGYIRGSLGDK